MIGIYKLMYTPTDDYYIGSSNNIKNRMHSHKSFFKNDKNIGALQELYNLDPNFDNFDYIVLEECEECDLAKKEKEYLELNIKQKMANNKPLIEYFNKFQAFCVDLSSDSVLKGELNFNYN